MKRRLKSADFFIPLEQVCFPPTLLDDPEMSHQAIRFAAVLGRKWRINTMTQMVDTPPRIEQIAAEMGVKRRMALYALNELVSKQYIQTVRRHGVPTYVFRAPQMQLDLAISRAKGVQYLAPLRRTQGVQDPAPHPSVKGCKILHPRV